MTGSSRARAHDPARLREVTAIVRLGQGCAILFGVDWNATITGAPEHLDYLERETPGVLVDFVKQSDAP